jgi:molybdopterin synthase catalytic subunit
MQVRVLFFGMLKDAAGRTSDTLQLPERATLADLLERCAEKFPALPKFFGSLALSVNQEYAARGTMLHENDEVALLPPVSGGSVQAEVAEAAYVQLVRERIVPHDIIPALEKPEDGAIVVFDGIVRNHSRGRQTLYLDYEAYEEMALKELRRLADEARSKFAIRNLALVHRLGRLQIGESSVLIAVYAGHRAAAFDACRWLIDTLKRTVPIWKKEHFADGAVWADGEPFPAEIKRLSS